MVYFRKLLMVTIIFINTCKIVTATFFFFFLALGMKLRALKVVDKHFTTQWYP